MWDVIVGELGNDTKVKIEDAVGPLDALSQGKTGRLVSDWFAGALLLF